MLTQRKLPAKALNSWFRQLGRIEELKKKERATIARSLQIRGREEAAAIRKITMMREPTLMRVPTDKLMAVFDKMARHRQEQRRTRK